MPSSLVRKAAPVTAAGLALCPGLRGRSARRRRACRRAAHRPASASASPAAPTPPAWESSVTCRPHRLRRLLLRGQRHSTATPLTALVDAQEQYGLGGVQARWDAAKKDFVVTRHPWRCRGQQEEVERVRQREEDHDRALPHRDQGRRQGPLDPGGLTRGGRARPSAPHHRTHSPTGGDGPGAGVWSKASVHTPAPARHRTHSSAQRTRPPQAQRRATTTAGKPKTYGYGSASIRSSASFAKLLGLRVDLDAVDDLARRPATPGPTPGAAGRSGSSSSRSRPSCRGRRSPCPPRRSGWPAGGPGSARCRWPTSSRRGAASRALMMYSVEPT